ncbi:hypothetical protein BH20ACT5_BH20ACT5_20730 [soil metagenome]
MTTTLPPGWYADPDGDPRLHRWWNGLGWSDVTMPAQAPPPGVATGVDAQPAGDVLQVGDPDRAPRGSRTAFLMLAAVVVVIVALAVGLLAVDRTTEGVVAVPGPTAQAPTDPGTTFPPGTTRIIDPEAGLSYAYLGEGWREWDGLPHLEMQTVHGQYIVTQERVPGGGRFIAECTSGLLGTQFPLSGTADYPAAIEAVADSVRASYYPGPNERDDLSAEPVTVAGRPAYLLEFDLSWDVPGYDSTGERIALLLIDTARERPALVYLSIPNTHAELYGAIDRVIASIELV